MSSVRSLLAALLVAAALLVGGFATVATWTQQHLLDSDRWTAAVGPLIEREEVRREVAAALTDAVTGDGQITSATRPVVSRAITQVVESSAFESVWSQAVRASHRELVAGLREEDRGLVLDGRGIVVDLGALVDVLAPRLAALGVPYVDSIKRPTGEIVLDSSPEVVRALTAARVLDRWATPSAIAAVVLLLAAVVVAPRRATLIAYAGLAVALLAVMTLLGWWAVRGIVLDQADPVGAVVLRALTGDVSRWLIVAAVVGGVASALSWGLGAQHLRHRLALR